MIELLAIAIIYIAIVYFSCKLSRNEKVIVAITVAVFLPSLFWPLVIGYILQWFFFGNNEVQFTKNA